MRLVLIGLTALALTACSGAPEKPAANEAQNAASVPANGAEAVNYVAEIGNMTEQDRQGVFLGAIRDADVPCRDVVKVEQVEPMQGIPTWRASCEEGLQHLIQVKPDGSAQVISRTTP
jgi:hypothetical protein